MADGLGAHEGGRIASNLAVESVLASFQRDPTLTSTGLEAHLKSANEALVTMQASEPKLSQMQTTLVILISDGYKAIWAHVGDSRLYILRAGKVVLQTRDHSVSQLKVDMGKLHPDGIRGDSDRSTLVQAVGRKGIFSPRIQETPEPLYLGDAFLLCVDGFWENVLETEMEIDLAKSSSAREWLRDMQLRLNRRLGSDADNYTAIAVRATNDLLEPRPAPVEDHGGGKESVLKALNLPTRRRVIISVLAAIALSQILVLRVFLSSPPVLLEVKLPFPKPPVTWPIPPPLEPRPSPSVRPPDPTLAKPPLPTKDAPAPETERKRDSAPVSTPRPMSPSPVATKGSLQITCLGKWKAENLGKGWSTTGSLTLRDRILVYKSTADETDQKTWDLKVYSGSLTKATASGPHTLLLTRRDPPGEVTLLLFGAISDEQSACIKWWSGR